MDGDPVNGAVGYDVPQRRLELAGVTLSRRMENGKGVWRLEEVAETAFTTQGPRTERRPELDWHSRVSPDMLDALIVRPERMSAWALHKYT